MTVFFIGNPCWADQIIYPGESVIARQNERVACVSREISPLINAYCTCETEYDNYSGYRLVKGIYGDNTSRVNIVRGVTQTECSNLVTDREICGQRTLRQAIYKSCETEMEGGSGYRLVTGNLTNATPRINIMRNIPSKENCIQLLRN